MPGWSNSDRRERLPADWEQIRKRILQRDSCRCTWIADGKRCAQPATDVDHRVPGDDHSDSNLRSLCSFHHNRKSGSEGAAALAKKKRENARKFKRIERHPGLI